MKTVDIKNTDSKKKNIIAHSVQVTTDRTNPYPITRQRTVLSTSDITTIALMVAIIEACKIVLAGIPNVELTTFWVILFTLHLGKRIAYVIPAFILIEGAMYGFGLWWVMYLYSWPLLALIVWKLRSMDSAIAWSILSGTFGLLYGALCSIPYFAIGTVGEGLESGLASGFAWWIAGIPFDLIHGIANFILMLTLFTPVNRMLKKYES